MKTLQPLILMAGLSGLLATASAQVPPVSLFKSPAGEPSPATAGAPAPKQDAKSLIKITSETEKGLRFNFRGASLEAVLGYLSEAAGFIIIPQVDIRGSITAWSNDSLTKNEAVMVLDAVLARNGYAAIRDGRTLTLVSREEARRKNITVRKGGDPAAIPRTEEMATQIIPLKFISAAQVMINLEQLLPSSASLTANEGANALILTDTQANIHRVAEIVRALDTPISSISSVKVFPLKHADARALAGVVRELFQSQEPARGGATGTSTFQQFFRSPGGPGANDSGAGGASETPGTGRTTTPRVVATVDELSNSLIVAAPAEQMPLIEEMVRQLDVTIEDVTELRVFKLKHSSPQDLADVLKSLFPDLGNNQSSGVSQFSGGFGSSSGAGDASGNTSERRLKLGRVNTVAELRTSSLLVSAPPVLMEQIAGIISKLDADTAKQQKLFIIPVENSDPQQIQAILQNLFPSQNSNSRSSQGAQGTTTRVAVTGNSGTSSNRSNGGTSTGGSSGFGGSSSGSIGGGSGFGGGSSGGRQ